MFDKYEHIADGGVFHHFRFQVSRADFQVQVLTMRMLLVLFVLTADSVVSIIHYSCYMEMLIPVINKKRNTTITMEKLHVRIYTPSKNNNEQVQKGKELA